MRMRLVYAAIMSIDKGIRKAGYELYKGIILHDNSSVDKVYVYCINFNRG